MKKRSIKGKKQSIMHRNTIYTPPQTVFYFVLTEQNFALTGETGELGNMGLPNSGNVYDEDF